MNISQERQIFSSGIFRIVGYGLLIMFAIDFVFLLIPLQLMNPVWEFQTMGAIIERIPVALLGMVLVYYGERDYRAPIEKFILKWLSWLCLAIAIFLILIIPLSITNSSRIYYQHNAQLNYQIVGQIERLQDFQNRLETANSSEDIETIIAKNSKQSVTIPESLDIKQLKLDIVQNLQENQDNLRNKAQLLRSQKRSTLLKDCIKWNLGALIAACLFFMLWKATLWSRLQVDSDNY
ncbi:MAG: hypothetical protein Tsb0014_21180 [Pleurocapsa sp.]